MIQELFIYVASGFNPHHNLAIEKCLLDKVRTGSCILYLWQNQNTVVIGSNQNAWQECRTSLLESEGGVLARRLSGGGAVFHDLGNLNFTFLVCEEDYNVNQQLSVIQTACALAGIATEPSGRNDILAEGKKFSGNAFYHHQGKAYHHGTLLIDADMEKLQRYLSPPKAKLEAKGVSSVRSRVVNLSTLSHGLTCDDMKRYMATAFQQVYGLDAQVITLSDAELSQIADLEKTFSDWDFLYGKPLPFTFSCEEKFSWGYVNLQLQVTGGIVQQAKLYSDAMDWQFPELVKNTLTGCRFTLKDMRSALQSALTDSMDIANDLCSMLSQQEI